MTNDRDALDELRSVSNIDAIHTIRHYLYFPLEDTAVNVAGRLRGRGFSVENQRGADGVTWLVLLTERTVPTESRLAEMRAMLEQIATDNSGEYDGWEADVRGEMNESGDRSL
jgi:hypothetical protein